MTLIFKSLMLVARIMIIKPVDLPFDELDWYKSWMIVEQISILDTHCLSPHRAQFYSSQINILFVAGYAHGIYIKEISF